MTTTSEKSTKQLFSELVGNVRQLARGHAEDVKAEAAAEKRRLKRAPILMGAAGGVALVGALLAGQAIALGLTALGLAAWLGHAIVSFVLLVIGFFLVRRMPSRSEVDMVPQTALKRIGSDMKEVAKEVAHDVRR